MANSPQARKRARQEGRSRARNMAQRAKVRTQIKKYLKLIEDNDIEASRDEYRKVTSNIDVAARKGLHHPNKAARLKSRLNTRLKNISAPTG